VSVVNRFSDVKGEKNSGVPKRIRHIVLIDTSCSTSNAGRTIVADFDLVISLETRTTEDIVSKDIKYAAPVRYDYVRYNISLCVPTSGPRTMFCILIRIPLSVCM